MKNFLESIRTLRLAYPDSMLGNRERSILFSKGARVRRVKKERSPLYRVTAGDSYFEFLYGDRYYGNFMVTG